MSRSLRIIGGRILVLAALALVTSCGESSNNDQVVQLGPQSTGFASSMVARTDLQLNGTNTASALFVDANGNPIANLPVTFSTSLGTLNPANGSAVTNAQGIASIGLLGGNSFGNGIVTATGTVGGREVSTFSPFAVAFPQVNVSNPTLQSSTLVPGGTTTVTVNLTDASGLPYRKPTTVNFSSLFTANNGARFNPAFTNVSSGTATTTYTADTVGSDRITVSIRGAETSVPITINAGP